MVTPPGIDDLGRPSGGNTYDRQLISGLVADGYPVQVRPAPGSWPVPDSAALKALESLLTRTPDDSVVLLDGLVASASGGLLRRHAPRVRLVILMHMPLGSVSEHDAVASTAAVITTSAWTRDWLITRYALAPGRVHVAEPGVQPADIAERSPSGGRFICVAAVVPHKGQDVLADALLAMTHRDWDCRFVGALGRDSRFVAQLRTKIHEAGADHRIGLAGVRSGDHLAATYASADLLIAPSRTEAYGMAVTEALARGIPVVTTDVGGLPAAMGHDDKGSRPGILIQPDDPARLAQVLGEWLDDEPLRRRLRESALQRRETLPRWKDTTAQVAQVLAGVAA